jgi:hypothetical protein
MPPLVLRRRERRRKVPQAGREGIGSDLTMAMHARAHDYDGILVAVPQVLHKG